MTKAWLFVKVLIFTVFVPGAVAGYGPYRVLMRQGGLPPWHLAAGTLPPLLLVLMGAVVYLRCAWDFAVAGGGTPAPVDAPKRLVIAGIYRHTRNPMYLGVGAAILGEAWMFRSQALLVYFAIFFAIINGFVIFYEEPTLKARFGADYEAYKNAVPRWFIRVKPWKSDASGL